MNKRKAASDLKALKKRFFEKLQKLDNVEDAAWEAVCPLTNRWPVGRLQSAALTAHKDSGMDDRELLTRFTDGDSSSSAVYQFALMSWLENYAKQLLT